MSDGGKGSDTRPTDIKRFGKNFDGVNFDAEKSYESEIIKNKIGVKTYQLKPKGEEIK